MQNYESIKTFIDKYTEWGEHPVYTSDRWKIEINKNITRQAYWVWVEDQHQKELDEAEDAMYSYDTRNTAYECDI